MLGRASRPPLPTAEVLETLVARGSTLATAESLTGGQLAALLTAVPGASRCFRGGVVSYATDVKVSLLGVPSSVVAGPGVISAECALAMARGVRDALAASYGMSTTGVAGPSSQEGHPPGTVFIGLSGLSGDRVLSLELAGSRDEIQRATCREALLGLAALLAAE